ncbi:MAG: hypothetical protein GEV10_05175 [Streptosporangiales bacterium]|nr:hypothetical protein [Streptosporangiales bacterium]
MAATGKHDDTRSTALAPSGARRRPYAMLALATGVGAAAMVVVAVLYAVDEWAIWVLVAALVAGFAASVAGLVRRRRDRARRSRTDGG